MCQPVCGLRLRDLLRAAIGCQPDGGHVTRKRCELVRQTLVLLLAGGELFVRQADVFLRRACCTVEAGRREAVFAQRGRCGVIRALVDDHQQILALQVGADAFDLRFACGSVNGLAQRVKLCLRRNGTEQHARVLRPACFQRQIERPPRHKALAQRREAALFRLIAAACVLRVQRFLRRLHSRAVRVVVKQLAERLFRPGGEHPALFRFIVLERFQRGGECGGCLAQRVRACAVCCAEQLRLLRFGQRLGRADLDASEQLQLTNELILFLRDAAQPNFFHF